MEPESHEQAHESIRTFLETEKQQLWDRIHSLEKRIESWFTGPTVSEPVQPQGIGPTGGSADPSQP